MTRPVHEASRGSAPEADRPTTPRRCFPAAPTGAPGDPDGLRAAWATLERTWAATLERVAAVPAGTVDVSVGGE